MGTSKILITNLTHSLKDPLHVRLCSSFFCRLRGLMFRSNLKSDDGLLFIGSRDSRLDSAIHMFFVFTNLAVIWIDSHFRVVDSVLASAWHPAYLPAQPARYILEIDPARFQEFTVGDQLEWHHG
jgi:uncharacterized membrane protein (UPF0127 family)